MRPRIVQLVIIGASSLLAAALVFTVKLLVVPPRTQARPSSAPSPLSLTLAMPSAAGSDAAHPAASLTAFLLWLSESDVRLAAATGGVLAAIALSVLYIISPLPHTQIAVLKRRLIVFFVTKALLVALILHPLHNAELAVWAVWFAVQAGVSTLALTAKYRAAVYVGTPQPAERHRLLCLLAILLPTHTLLALATVGAFGQLTWSITALLAADNVIAGGHTAIALARYLVTVIDARHEGRWEYKTDALLYIDSLGECFTLFLSLAHYGHVWYVHGLAFSFIHPLLATLCLFSALALRAHAQYALRYRELSRQLDGAFTDATAEQLAASDDDEPAATCAAAAAPSEAPRVPATPRRAWKDCNICLEPMSRGKRLPGCGHMFHRACLRRWLLNGNGTCPLCRQDILNVPHIATPTRLASFADDFSHQQYPEPSGTTRTARHTPRAGDAASATLNASTNARATASSHSRGTGSSTAAGSSTSMDAAVQHLVSAFPHLSVRALRRHLMFVADGDVNITAEAALRGDIPTAPLMPNTVDAPVSPASGGAPAPSMTPSSPRDGGAEVAVSSGLRHRHALGANASSTLHTLPSAQASSLHARSAATSVGAAAAAATATPAAATTAAGAGAGLGTHVRSVLGAAAPGARRRAFLHAASQLSDEEMEAETQALLQSAQLCGCKPDPWALSSARFTAMQQRSRRAYARTQLAVADAAAAAVTAKLD